MLGLLLAWFTIGAIAIIVVGGIFLIIIFLITELVEEFGFGCLGWGFGFILLSVIVGYFLLGLPPQ